MKQLSETDKIILGVCFFIFVGVVTVTIWRGPDIRGAWRLMRNQKEHTVVIPPNFYKERYNKAVRELVKYKHLDKIDWKSLREKIERLELQTELQKDVITDLSQVNKQLRYENADLKRRMGDLMQRIKKGKDKNISVPPMSGAI